MAYDFEEALKKELAYDLRQGLAKRLDEILNEIANARFHRNFEHWLKFLDSLFIELSKKLNDDEKDEYNKLLNKTNKIISEHPKAFSGDSKNDNEVYSILKEINMWLEMKMEKNKMFGAKEEPEDF